MRRIKSSIVAWSLGASLISFAALYYVIPYERFLDLALAVAFGVSLAGTIKYGQDAIVALRSGKSGAEFLIVSVFAIMVTILSQRIWGIVLRVYDRPDWLVNSPIAILIPWLLSWAMSLALVAPDIDLDTQAAKTGIWKSAALFIGGALAGFVIAASFSMKKDGSVNFSELEFPRLMNRSTCKPTEPVWVSSNGIYHLPNSPYRGSIVPRWCFATEEEALAAGYRKWKK